MLWKKGSWSKSYCRHSSMLTRLCSITGSRWLLDLKSKIDSTCDKFLFRSCNWVRFDDNIWILQACPWSSKKNATMQIRKNLIKLHKSYIGRSSHRRCSVGKGVLRNFTKFTGKHLCQSLYFNYFKIETLAQVFFCEFCEISKNTFLQNTSGRLLLYRVVSIIYIHERRC